MTATDLMLWALAVMVVIICAVVSLMFLRALFSSFRKPKRDADVMTDLRKDRVHIFRGSDD